MIWLKRIVKDVAELHKNPLTDNGIYYIHNEENILNGYALIVGPPDTVYEYGFYFFKFVFNENYPVEPPKVFFHTYDKKENTRFHPNLYRNGKVCLSIINTWRGEGWSSCQSISSVLLSISSILTNNPLIEEPGIRQNHIDILPYNNIIKYKNYEIAILETIKYKNGDYDIFNYIIKSIFEKNKDIILEKLNYYNEKKLPCINSVHIYNMNLININYKRLIDNFRKLI